MVPGDAPSGRARVAEERTPCASETASRCRCGSEVCAWEGAQSAKDCGAAHYHVEVDLFLFHDMPLSPEMPESPLRATRDMRTHTRDRNPSDTEQSLPQAERASLPLSPRTLPPRKAFRRRIRRQDSTLSPRDRDVLLALGRCRILSFDQLRRDVFPRLSPQRVGQRLRALAAEGWLHVWEDVSRIGGRPRYALPTRRALALAVDVLQRTSVGLPTERLAGVVLRGRPRRPLLLHPRATPAFLAHQRECNDLLLAYRRIPGARLLWSTSFDRPFPLHAHGVTLPQPDYVLVLEHNGTPALVFGEHDRGHESLAHFRRTKAERYAALAARPELTMELVGFARFVVWVTVLDARAGAPLRRMETLARVARDAAASDVMAFSLAGWVAATPAAAIWRFADDACTAAVQSGLIALPLPSDTCSSPHTISLRSESEGVG